MILHFIIVFFKSSTVITHVLITNVWDSTTGAPTMEPRWKCVGMQRLDPFKTLCRTIMANVCPNTAFHAFYVYKNEKWYRYFDDRFVSQSVGTLLWLGSLFFLRPQGVRDVVESTRSFEVGIKRVFLVDKVLIFIRKSVFMSSDL